MSKFLYFQDFHIKGKNSVNRLGNFFQDCLTKLDEIISLAQENKCDAIIDGGDLFESEKPSYSVLDAVADRIEKTKIPLYSLFGNHSMAYGHIENKKDTGLAHLQKRSKYFNYLIDDFPPFPDEMRADGWEIKSIEYKFGIEDTIKKNGIIFDDGDYWKIAIVHALVTQNKFFDEVSHVQCKNIETNADIVLLAHYHKPFEKKINNTTFLNIGCCGRDNIDEAKIEPSVLLLDTDKRSYEVIKLKSAKRSNEIFDLSKYEELKANKKDIKEFLNSLKDANFQSMSIAEQVVKIGKEQKVEENVINYVLEKIENVK